MGYQRNKKIYVIQSQNLQTTDKGKRSASKNRKTKKNKKIKIYWNKTTDLLETSKQAHPHKHFEENKKNGRVLE